MSRTMATDMLVASGLVTASRHASPRYVVHVDVRLRMAPHQTVAQVVEVHAMCAVLYVQTQLHVFVLNLVPTSVSASRNRVHHILTDAVHPA